MSYISESELNASRRRVSRARAVYQRLRQAYLDYTSTFELWAEQKLFEWRIRIPRLYWPAWYTHRTLTMVLRPHTWRVRIYSKRIWPRQPSW